MENRDQSFERLYFYREPIMKRVLFAFFSLLILLNSSRTNVFPEIWSHSNPSMKVTVLPELVSPKTTTLQLKGDVPFLTSNYSIEFSFNGGQDWFNITELGGQILSSNLKEGTFEMDISIEPQFYFGQLSYENGLKTAQKMKSFLVRAHSESGRKTLPTVLVLFYEEQSKKAAQWAAF